ncbi:MAG: RraA family protein [Planctomycetota bacterium]
MGFPRPRTCGDHKQGDGGSDDRTHAILPLQAGCAATSRAANRHCDGARTGVLGRKGIAHTAEYEVIDAPLVEMSYEEFDERQYKKGPEGLWHEAGPWGAPDEVLVIDAKRTAAGILGSNNTLGGRAKGVVGFVIDGTCRDSGECVFQQTPVFSTVRSPAHPMGRIGPVSGNRPITCAGAPVAPGDAIAADDDGVVVVPQELAEEVARRAKLIQDKDRPGRRAGYEGLGLPLDDTVR